jgi:hypothetical protein
VTLLVSFYSASGIAYAADNAVTVQTLSGDKRADNQKKVFAVPNVGMNGGVVGCFGAAEVGAEDMEPWMTGHDHSVDRFAAPRRFWRLSMCRA